MVSVGLVPLYIGLTQEKAKEVAMNGHAREGEERGRGIPLSDIDHVMRHYNVDEATAEYYLSIHPVEMLLPERGYGLTSGPLIGTSISELGTALNLMEDSLDIGEKARLDLATYDLPLQHDLDTMWLEMVTSGLHVSRPTAKIVDGIPLTSMVLTKGSPAWALIIPLIIPIAIVGLIAFGITKLETITKALLPLVLATGGFLVIGIALMRKPVERAVERFPAEAVGKYLR